MPHGGSSQEKSTKKCQVLFEMSLFYMINYIANYI